MFLTYVVVKDSNYRLGTSLLFSAANILIACKYNKVIIIIINIIIMTAVERNTRILQIDATSSICKICGQKV